MRFNKKVFYSEDYVLPRKGTFFVMWHHHDGSSSWWTQGELQDRIRAIYYNKPRCQWSPRMLKMRIYPYVPSLRTLLPVKQRYFEMPRMTLFPDKRIYLTTRRLRGRKYYNGFQYVNKFCSKRFIRAYGR